MMKRNAIALSYDVVIVGGGLTGICAAIASARGGAKTALIHDRAVLGGNASSEIRMHVCGATANMKKPELSEGGILHELMLSNKYVNDSYNFSIWDAVLFDAVKKEPNLTLFLNTAMHTAHKAEDAVTEIECYQLTTERHLRIGGKIFIDCSGNGTLCAFVDAAYRTGSEGRSEHGEPHAPETPNNRRMGNTLLFKAADRGHPIRFIPPVEVMHFTEEQLKYRKHSPVLSPDVMKNITPEEMHTMFSGFAQDYGYWWIEICGEKENIIEEYEDIRDKLVSAVYGIWNHIKNDGDHGAENYELVWVGMLPGVRESRRIECDYMLTENDVLSNRRFTDAVAYGGWDIDSHTNLFAFDEKPSFVYPVDGSYDIPYRSYCVKGFRNLLVGGRCMGASKLAMSSTRVMGTCAIGGQAIGTAAAMVCRTGDDRVRSVDIKALQERLFADDCYLPSVVWEREGNLVTAATLTASSEAHGFSVVQLKSGVNRKIGRTENAWHSLPLCDGKPETLTVDFEKPVEVHSVTLVFDSNFNIEKKITLSSKRQSAQEIGVPKELVRSFTLRLIAQGETVKTIRVKDNHQRLLCLALDGVSCDSAVFSFDATWGDPCIRLFDVRFCKESPLE